MRWLLTFGILSGLAFGCGDDDRPVGPTDGGDRPDSASPIACPDLDPEEPGELVVAKVDFATGTVELFNPTDTVQNVDEFQFCHRQATPAYVAANMQGPTSVNPGGYATYTMPDSWFASATNGDFALYRNSTFGDGENIIDYICWGDPDMAGPNRFTEADEAIAWDNPCLSGISMGAITRLPSTSGLGTESYDVTSAFVATPPCN